MSRTIVIAFVASLLGLSSSQPTPSPDSVTFRCPEICAPFREAFTECAPVLRLGCAPVPCGVNSFGCEKQITPGEDVVFNAVEFKEKLKINIDLNAASVTKTDIYLLSDATASMGGAINTVKEKFDEIVSFFEGKGTDARFGLGFYRDEIELKDGFENTQPLTTNLASVKDAIGSLTATGGGDTPEANLVALYRVATDDSIGWSDGARRIIIQFGDVPGHEPTCVDGKTIDRLSVVDVLNAKNIRLLVASFRGEMDSITPTAFCGVGKAGTNQAIDIATASGGLLVTFAEADTLVETIVEGLDALPQDFDVDTSDCDAFLSFVFNPKLPVTVAPGSTQTLSQTMEVLQGACDSGEFTCDIRYTQDDAETKPSTVKVLDVTGCPPTG